MFAPIPIPKTALLLGLALALAACGKQDDQATASPAAAASSAFPAGNSDNVRTAADCDRLPDPTTPDDSAAGRATAVSQGVAARAACKKAVAAQQDKPNADLARIREIKEKEQADLADRNISEKEFGKRFKEAGSQPIREYKY